MTDVDEISRSGENPFAAASAIGQRDENGQPTVDGSARHVTRRMIRFRFVPVHFRNGGDQCWV